MVERYTPPEPDPRIEAIDAELTRCHAPGVEASHVAGRVFEQSRAYLARGVAADRPRLRVVDEDGPSMLPGHGWSAWPVMAALAALVVVATGIAILYSVQSARNNRQIVLDPATEGDAAIEYSVIDDDFEDEFEVATSALMSDISASVDSLVAGGDEWAHGALASELQSATSSLWEDLDSF